MKPAGKMRGRDTDMPPHGTRPNGAINREHHRPRSRERSFHRFVEFYSSPKACSKIFQPYLPLAEQDRIGQAFAASEQALIAASEAPADLGDRLRELGPLLLFPKYRSDGLRELLATYVPDITLAGVWTERNRGIVTPSFQLSAVSPSGTRQWAVRLLNNLPNVAWMSDTKVIDAILASAAAPVFFPPHELPLMPSGNAFVDGGVFANNPSTAALAALLGSRLRARSLIIASKPEFLA